MGLPFKNKTKSCTIGGSVSNHRIAGAGRGDYEYSLMGCNQGEVYHSHLFHFRGLLYRATDRRMKHLFCLSIESTVFNSKSNSLIGLN